MKKLILILMTLSVFEIRFHPSGYRLSKQLSWELLSRRTRVLRSWERTLLRRRLLPRTLLQPRLLPWILSFLRRASDAGAGSVCSLCSTPRLLTDFTAGARD